MTAGRISPCPHNLEDLRLLSLPARSQRPDFHRGLRHGPLGQPITPDKAPLTAGFDTLIEKLQSINEHLNRQIVQQDELMRRLREIRDKRFGKPAEGAAAPGDEGGGPGPSG